MRRDHWRPSAASTNRESGLKTRPDCNLQCADVVYAGAGRTPRNALLELPHRVFGAFSFDFDAAVSSVAYPAADSVLCSNSLGEISEPDALYSSLDQISL